ncbi:hypothetical protein GCM10027277_15460 [Pseudoduganella ginsengisoli]|uniref:NTF2 fold domain-containing protein n=1 Tax=Pseudoduganella ginsengisoli TaxID=1462440 RepID=A0A6L6PUJ1_9BURK|nr:NTF2 fold immunity protein [Pseudoduganella ginsengisoli]MTW01193.1 hypothetical protein [Pseudoduganella ginsengisoli]
MKDKFLAIATVFVLSIPLLALAIERNQYKQEQVSKTGYVPKDGIKPKEGFIPNAATAIGIALLVLDPIYGADQIEKQKPFTADLRGDVWVVQGSIESGTGTAEVDLSKRTGAILRVTHGK